MLLHTCNKLWIVSKKIRHIRILCVDVIDFLTNIRFTGVVINCFLWEDTTMAIAKKKKPAAKKKVAKKKKTAAKSATVKLVKSKAKKKPAKKAKKKVAKKAKRKVAKKK